jgi:hypothetical protein
MASVVLGMSVCNRSLSRSYTLFRLTVLGCLRRPPIGCRARCGAEVRAQVEQGGGFCGGRAGREWWEEVECYEVVGAEGEVVCSLIFVGQVGQMRVGRRSVLRHNGDG